MAGGSVVVRCLVLRYEFGWCCAWFRSGARAPASARRSRPVAIVSRHEKTLPSGWTKRGARSRTATFASASALPKYEDESHGHNSGRRGRGCQRWVASVPPCGLVGSVTPSRSTGVPLSRQTGPPLQLYGRLPALSPTARLGAAAPAAPARGGRAADLRRPRRR